MVIIVAAAVTIAPFMIADEMIAAARVALLVTAGSMIAGCKIAVISQGLTLDIARGNLLRLGKDGVILAASHGTRYIACTLVSHW
jgi:hypothetical protein